RLVMDRMSAAARRSSRRKKRGPGWRLAVETLEDRTLLSVTIVPGSGNAVGILGTVGDQVWLRTNSTQLQYSTDGTNYSNLGVNVTQDAPVTLGGLAQVHLMKTPGQGHALTLQALGVPNGSAGQLASPNLLTIEDTVYTAGGDLSVLNMQGIEVDSNVV